MSILMATVDTSNRKDNTMAKHVLSNVDGFKKRLNEVFAVDPNKIVVVGGWNARTDFSGEDELCESIKAGGIKQPLLVRKNKEGVLELIAGERRLRAARRLVSEGFDIPAPVVVAKRNASEIDLYIDSIIENTGKPLTPTEEAVSFKRCVDWGMAVKDIARRSGRSISHVRNRIELSGASPELNAAVDDGDITVRDAQEIVKDSDGKVAGQAEQLEKKKATPKKRAPRKAKKGESISDAMMTARRNGFIAGAEYISARIEPALIDLSAYPAIDEDIINAEAEKRYPNP